MDLRNLILSPASIGSNLLLVDIVPAYVYVNGKRTDDISGYKYVVAMQEHKLEKISIRIDGKQQMEMPDHYCEVTFDGLNLSLYWTPSGYQVAATAKAIKPVK